MIKKQDTEANDLLFSIIEDFFFHDYENQRTGLENAFDLATKILEQLEVKIKR